MEILVLMLVDAAIEYTNAWVTIGYEAVAGSNHLYMQITQYKIQISINPVWEPG